MNDPNPFSDIQQVLKAQPVGNEGKLHHHLISGEIFVAEDDSIGSIKLNSILQTQENRITAMDIGKAQQALQMQFFKRRNMENRSDINVVDVFIINISYLGLMKPSFFSKMDLPKSES